MTTPLSLRATVAAAVVAVVVSGTVTDRTTEQPLPNVRVDLTRGATHARGLTDARGRYVIRGVRPGDAHVTVESDDVPPQRFTVYVGPAPRRLLDLTACSTTLDYSCPRSDGDGF